MMSVRAHRHPFASRFRAGEEGAATVEAVIWTPLLFGFLIMVADVSMIFNGQARMMRIVQDTNRGLSVGRIQTAEEAMEVIRQKMADVTENTSVTTTITDGVIRTTLSVSASELDVVGWMAPLLSAPVTVSSEHFVEY